MVITILKQQGMILEDIKTYQPIISMAISMATLFIAIKVYLIFHRREIQKKQIELVLNLIHKLQTKEVWVRWMTSDEKTSGFVSLFSGNLLTIAKKIHTTDIGEFTSKHVYFSEELFDGIGINEYLYNPLTPNKIAKSLTEAFPNTITYSRARETFQDLIYIDKTKILDSKEFDENFPQKDPDYYCAINVDFSTLMKGLNDFRSQADRWLRKQGVKDLNLQWDDKYFRFMI